MSKPFDKHPAFVVRQDEPFNGGPPIDLLRREAITPIPLFFVRNHGGVPEVNPTTYRLMVDGLVAKPLSMSLDDLRKWFPRTTETAALECAGNRRQELMDVAPIPHELPWGKEAVGNARWSGVPLAEVLREAAPLAEAKHVEFTGIDTTERLDSTFAFGGSIPLEKAMGREVLLADQMNGSILPPVHGFPLRVVVPGYIGARSVKWLQKITLRDSPSENYFQARAYRLFPAHVNAENVEWDEGMMLGELSVNCLICRPTPDDTVTSGLIEVDGLARAGGGRTVERVEVSADGGKTWVSAQLGEQSSRWAWRFWNARIRVGPDRREIVARAWDSAAQTQPESVASLWNFKGYMNNAWARVRLFP